LVTDYSLNPKNIMRKIWQYISNLGISGTEDHPDQRAIILTNQLNFVMFMSMLILFAATFMALRLTNDYMSYGTLRILALLFLSFLNLLAARSGFVNLSRLSLIFLPTLIFLLGPTIILGYVEEESYTYYPYVVIAASIIPQLIINPKKEKFLYWFSVVFYLLLTVFIDIIMVRFGKEYFPIIDRINTFYPFYKISQVAVFMFINAGIFYLRILNFRYEEELGRKNAELDIQNKELREQKEKIEKHKDELISREISTWQKLVSIISHEIVNSAIPITNLAGMTGQMLEDESGTVLKPSGIGEETIEDIHHSIRVIESRTQALINFVKATRNLTQIPSPNKRRFSVAELFDRISILYQAKLKEAGISFKKQVTPSDLVIEADLELIEQVIINLIRNAAEAIHEVKDPMISLNAVKDDEGQVKISVSDNGEGINNEILEKIFIPFYSTKPGNSGIGLSLSRQIMMLHNGQIEVKSGSGENTTFTLVF